MIRKLFRAAERTAAVLISTVIMISIAAGGHSYAEDLSTRYRLYGRDNLDVVFVLDGSGSMETADKNKLAAEMVGLFIRFCDFETCRAGFVEYSHELVAEHELTDMSTEAARNSFLESVSAIDYDPSADTDIALGLTEAMEIHKRGMSKDRSPLIILLSDGRTDLPKGPRTVEESDAELDRTTAELKELGIPVFTVGLNSSKDDENVPESKKLDTASMRSIAEKTGAVRIEGNKTEPGTYEVTKAEQLLGVVTDIYSQVGKVSIENIDASEEGEWLVFPFNIKNSSIFFVNIYIESKAPITEIKLSDPSGEDVPLSNSDKLYYTPTNNYTLIKLFSPASGPWQLRVKGVSKSDISVTFLGTYDLYAVQTPSSNQEIITGGKVHFAAALFNEDGRISDVDLIASLTGSVEKYRNGEEPEVIAMDSNNDGSFSRDITFNVPGTYVVSSVISASDGSFRKESGSVFVTVVEAFEEAYAEQQLSADMVRAGSESVEITAGLYYRSALLSKDSISDDMTASVYIEPFDDQELEIAPIQAQQQDDGTFTASFTPPKRGRYTIYTVFKNTTDLKEIKSSQSVLSASRADITSVSDTYVSVYSLPFCTSKEISLSRYFSWDTGDKTETAVYPSESGGYIAELVKDKPDTVKVSGKGFGSGSFIIGMKYADSDSETRMTVHVKVKNALIPIFLAIIAIMAVILIVKLILWRLHPAIPELDLTLRVPAARSDVRQPPHFRLNIPAGTKKTDLMSALKNDEFNYESISGAIADLEIGGLLSRIHLEGGSSGSLIITTDARKNDGVTIDNEKVTGKRSDTITQDGENVWEANYSCRDSAGNENRVTGKLIIRLIDNR
ncbi:MAG: VWA domain-containing protein [Ruminococcus sp.]|nr:VWA domain-containing protein [Ruminococcus sp.]